MASEKEGDGWACDEWAGTRMKRNSSDIARRGRSGMQLALFYEGGMQLALFWLVERRNGIFDVNTSDAYMGKRTFCCGKSRLRTDGVELFRLGRILI
jgi:hypothetical protein